MAEKCFLCQRPPSPSQRLLLTGIPSGVAGDEQNRPKGIAIKDGAPLWEFQPLCRRCRRAQQARRRADGLYAIPHPGVPA